ncbi:MAG: nucleotide exchange factor GrpE [Candidatus Marinimicrobia bacterium]|nr:nucleotide exchange factor GrpE [Candidatus Neomarinimicrobiota bacterium]
MIPWFSHKSGAHPEPLTDWKEQILDDFRRWLAAQPEMPPEELPTADPAPPPDLATLLDELAALRQEVRGLGRTSARLAAQAEETGTGLRDQLATVSTRLEAEATALSQLDTRREDLARTREEAARPLLLEVADLADALYEVAGRPPPTLAWPAYVPRCVRRRVADSLPDTGPILRAKADAALRRQGLRPVAAVGDDFDPARMNAAGVSDAGQVAPGCVSAIIRQGYGLSRGILRVAEVIVEQEPTENGARS